MKRPILLSALLALGLATLASGQNIGKYSNAPTDADYRMIVVEPKEGATLVGKDINIVLTLPAMPQGNPAPQANQDQKQQEMNTPTFQIWVDGKNFGNLPIGQNVFVARDLSYGPHKVVVMAKNISGQVVDRKEISVTTVETASSVSVTQSAAPAPYVAERAPAPAPRIAIEPPATTHYTSESPTLPKTATSYPLAAASGLLLLGAGALLRRKS